MLPEVKAYLTINFEWYVYLFALALPVGIALLAYVLRGVLYSTVWYNPRAKQPYTDILFWVALGIFVLLIINGFYTFIGEVRDYLSHHPKAAVWYHNQPYDVNYTLLGSLSLFAFIAGVVTLYLIERREKFLGAVPFYTVVIFGVVTPLFYNVQFEREGLLPKEVAGTILALELICFFVLHWALNRRFRFIKSEIILPLSLLMGWVIIGFFIFPYQLSAIKNVKQLVAYAMIFYAIVFFVKSEKHLRVVLWTAIIAANVSVLWGEMRFFGINIFGLPASYFQEPKAGKSFLLSGFFANPNYFAEYLALIILMCIGLALFTKHKGTKIALYFIAGLDTFHLLLTYTRAAWVGIGLGAVAAELLFVLYLLKQKPLEASSSLTTSAKRFLLTFLGVVISIRAMTMLLALYLMFSKSLYTPLVISVQVIAIAIIGVELWLFTKGNAALKSEPEPGGGFLESPGGAIAVTIVSLLIVFGAFYGVTKNLAEKTASYPQSIAPSERAASLADVKGDETFRNRLNMWRVAWEMIKAHPIFGYGLGSYEIEYLKYQDRIVDRYSFEQFSEWFHNTIPTFRAHNDHIQLLTELGIVGFIFWVWLWVAIFHTAWGAFTNAPTFGERFFVLTIFASMVSINISAFFSFPYHEIHTGGLVLMLAGFLAYLRYRQIQSLKTPAKEDTRESRAKGKVKAKTLARADGRSIEAGAIEPDVGEYEGYTYPGGVKLPMTILKVLVFAMALALTALGNYTQVQHFRSNTFFAWGSRFITEKYGNDYNSARDYWFRRAVELNPDNGRAEFFWGWATSKTEQYEDAVRILLHSQKLYPQTDTHYTLGLTYTWWGNKLLADGDETGAREKYHDAIDALITASKRLPTRLEYYTELVKLLNRVGRFREAEEYSDRAIIVYHWVTMAQNVEYLFYLWKGQALIAENRLDDAIQVLSEAPKLVYDKQNPDQKAKGAKPAPLIDQPQAYLLLGQAYEKKGDLTKAEEQYNIYLTKNNRLPKENRSNDIIFFQGRLYEKIADSQPEAESRLKYKSWATEKYRMLVKLNEDYTSFIAKKGTALTNQDLKQFYTENGRPLSEKMYDEALKGLQRIETGQPYPKEEEVVPIESESVNIGEAQIDTEDAGGK